MLKRVKRVLSQIAFILDKKQKLQLWGVLLVIILTTFVELVGVTIVLPLVELIMNPDIINEGGLLGKIYYFCGFKSVNYYILFIAISFIVIYFVKNIFIIVSYDFQHKFTFLNQKLIATRMLRCYMKQNYSFHLMHNSAELIRGINTDVAMMFQAILAILGLVAETLICITLGIFLLLKDAMMTLIVASMLILFVLFFLKKFKVYLKQIGEEDRGYAMGIVKWLQQSFNGLKATKIMQREEFFLRNFDYQYDKWANLERTYRNLQIMPRPMMESLCIAALMVAIIIKVQMGTDMAAFAGTISVFAIAAFRLLPSFNRITTYISAMAFNSPAFEAVYSELKKIDELHIEEGSSADAALLPFEKEIELKDISYKYETADDYVLQNINFVIPKNSSVAFVGPSGSGKTTLVDIVLGLLMPASGDILVDGTSVKTHMSVWQKHFGYIPQTIYLMDDTIRNNILYGADLDQERLQKAVQEAQLTDFIATLPNGLDTEIGEAGVRLSGGQRQRIGIARALYSNPEILILDEATSALDGETESGVMDAIKLLSGKKTIIIIAHRLSTVAHCDYKIEVANKGVKLLSEEEFSKLCESMRLSLEG